MYGAWKKKCQGWMEAVLGEIYRKEMETQLQREKQKADNREYVLKKTGREYAAFREEMLARKAYGIYDCCKIRFYREMRKYFLQHGHMGRKFLETAAGREKILEELWAIYMKDAEMELDTQEDIENMLQAYANKYALTAGTEGLG